MKKQAKTWVEISKRALTQNLKTFRRHVGSDTALMAVVKSNAYGHGIETVSPVADDAGADWFGVDNVDEALTLRRIGIKKPILVLGYTQNDRLVDCIRQKISFVAYNEETLKALRAILKAQKKSETARIHIKIETGTSRQGISGDALKSFLLKAARIPGVKIEGLSTHYANIEDTTNDAYAKQQLSRFQDAVKTTEATHGSVPWKHTACSAAIVLFPETYFNLVRLGVSMYGLWSSKETRAVAQQEDVQLKLEPVLTWKTIVAQVKYVTKGTPISYGLTERVARDSKIAVLPIGYWDGYDRAGLSSVGTVIIRGQRCKILGRICMNMCMVDITDVPGVRVEDEVILLGGRGADPITADELAAKCGTINYEIVTRINPLIPRILVQ